jgi:hypothetical protein
MNCPNCNQTVAANARFCGSCGTPISPAQPQSAAPSPPPLQTLEPALVGAHATGAGPRGPGSPGASSPLLTNLIERAKNMLLTPKTEWPVVAGEATSIQQLYINYVGPLAVFAAILAFVHVSIIGIHVPFGGGTLREPFAAGLASLVMTLVGAVIGLFIVGIIINVLAPTFGGVRDMRQAMKTAAYAFTPAWLSVVFALLPSFGTLLQFIANCYGIYLLYLGLPIVMRGRKESAAGYTASVVVCTIVLGFVISGVMIAAGGFGLASGAFSHLIPSNEASKAEERDQAAATVGNVLGNMLGTDAKGKQDLGAALSKVAAAGDSANAAGKSAGSAAADSAGSAAPPSQADTEKAFGAAGGLVAALGGALGGAHRVAPVDFQTLKALLPATLPDMERTNAAGEAKQGLGMKSTDATGSYKAADGSTVEIAIADVSAVAGLMDVAEGLPQTTTESDSGYEKDVSLGGRKVHEKFDAHSHHSELQTIVGKRFTVNLTGQGVDMSKLESDLGAVDLAKLEAMKDANPQN